MDEMRNLLQDVELVIIDELSMVSSDMLYKISQRLCEIFVSEDYFGGKAVLLVGDLMQLEPVLGKFIFKPPMSPKYAIVHKMDPLWKCFEIAVLKTNHRQGEGNSWTDTLNRIRVGQLNDEDIKLLESRRCA